MRIRLVIGSLIALVAVAPSLGQTPLTTAFTYQGQLKQGGAPFDGTAHLRFSLWDAAGNGSPPVGGSQIGASQLLANVPVANGLFSVQFNAGRQFGANAFNGEARWLQVEACADAGCGTLTILAPRQPLTATPHTLFALNAATATNATNAWGLSGNSGTNAGASFLGTTDNQPLVLSSPLKNSRFHAAARIGSWPVMVGAGTASKEGRRQNH